VSRLIRATRTHLASLGPEVAVDWHGHNDRGLGLANALEALRSGADRLHGTALGIGERVGNTPLELLIVNLRQAGADADRTLRAMARYCETASRALDWPIPVNYPMIGRDAFRTATGIHAAAIAKAEAQGDSALAECVYSSVAASRLGRSQDICIGFQSGHSNVEHWLRRRGIAPTEALVAAVLQRAKAESRLLTDDEVLAIVQPSD
jgi:2-isopropylmalate synthase